MLTKSNRFTLFMLLLLSTACALNPPSTKVRIGQVCFDRIKEEIIPHLDTFVNQNIQLPKSTVFLANFIS